METRWLPSTYEVLKINTDVASLDSKFDIGIQIYNHLNIPLLVKFVLCNGSYVVGYGELWGIIEGYYTVSLDLFENVLSESDLLLIIKSLLDWFDNFLKLGTLAIDFLNNIDRNYIRFSYFKSTENVPIYLSDKISLDSNVCFFAMVQKHP